MFRNKKPTMNNEYMMKMRHLRLDLDFLEPFPILSWNDLCSQIIFDGFYALFNSKGYVFEKFSLKVALNLNTFSFFSAM